MFLQHKMTPRGDPKRPNIAPRRFQDGIFSDSFSFFFWPSIFERLLVRFWCHLGWLLGAKIGHFWHRFFDDFRMSFQDRPKSGQERPRAPQEPPKSAQERPKRSPRAAKSGPRAPKSGPRAAKRGLRPAKSEQTQQKSIVDSKSKAQQ